MGLAIKIGTLGGAQFALYIRTLLWPDRAAVVLLNDEESERGQVFMRLYAMMVVVLLTPGIVAGLLMRVSPLKSILMSTQR